MRKIILRMLAAVLLLLAVLVVNTIWFKPFFIRAFYERVFVKFAFDSPELLSRLRLVEGLGIQGHNRKLDDVSEAENNRKFRFLLETQATLHRYDTTGMRGQDQLNYQVLDWYIAKEVAGMKFRYDNYPVNQLFGVQNDFPSFMADVHQVHNRRDADYYNERLAAVRVKFAQVLEGLKIREKHGVVPPTFVIDKVLTEMSGLVAQAPEQSILYTSLVEKLGKVKDLDAAAQAEILAETKRQITGNVYPAYQALIGYFTALRPRSTNDAGVWKFPDGKAYYAYCLQLYTTTNLSATQIHALGLSEVTRITAEMRAILQVEKISGADSVGPTMVRLGEEPRFSYPDTDSGRTQILADYRRILAEVDKGLGSAFRIRPKAALEVRRVPEFKQKTSPGAYYEPAALDGSRPGVFYANLYDVKATPKFGMRTLAYHEGIPGHHFQIGIAQELQGLPTFRTVIPFPAYGEGWALYAERLASELGFEKDPYDNLGRLRAELFRAVRLVVDTGIHDQRWTREQAINYMRRTTGMALSDVTAEVERYIVMPGQACSYKVGMLKILELRERAKQALGPKFDLRDFHDVVLKNGGLPLEILEQVVNNYIAAKKTAA
ncbi:DUF885 domain-containing protein [Hymenobacter sp. BT186]|uniref:DUF885 domain-containing protein n=1 Tax=Hymenobacter telluris TaxID=2816474 RepID=A0A939EWZ0_9BACT|nr:DUF885 domain-containing protein [Hymenobacter telluris]MBO0358681.1 DUF885 domain-containing protein [Hymenobacter telluris]MBW3374707.1 DUF885 domain-containing protein [Hymenobacter norwichensis]